MADFKSFLEADFDAYQPSKWVSNVYNLERLQVKQKLEVLGRKLSPKLASSKGPPLGWEVSIEHPAVWNNRKVTDQHLYFLRSPEARQEIQSRLSKGRTINNLLSDPSPYREHVHLSLSIDVDGLISSLTLFSDASIDHKNLLKKLENSWERSLFVDLITDLPSIHAIEIHSSQIPSHGDMTRKEISAKIIDQLSSTTSKAQPVLRVFSTLERTDPRILSPDLFETIEGMLKDLTPLYGYIQWRRDNDHLEVFKEVQEQRKERLSKGLLPNSRVRVTAGMWAGKKGVVQDIDSRGHLRVLIGTITVGLDADDVIAL